LLAERPALRFCFWECYSNVTVILIKGRKWVLTSHLHRDDTTNSSLYEVNGSSFVVT
jgi:hypothetical protein